MSDLEPQPEALVNDVDPRQWRDRLEGCEEKAAWLSLESPPGMQALCA